MIRDYVLPLFCFNDSYGVRFCMVFWALFVFIFPSWGQDVSTENLSAQTSIEKDTLGFLTLDSGFQHFIQPGDFLAITEANFKLAEYNYIKNDFRQSMAYLDLCLELATTHRLEVQKAKAYHLLGLNYDKLSLYAKALDQFFKSLSINETLDALPAIAENFNSIAKVYQHTGDFDKGLNYCLRALEIYEALDEDKGRMRSLLNIGVIHQKEHNNEVAMAYYQDALKISESIDDKGTEAILTGNIGSTMMQQGHLT